MYSRTDANMSAIVLVIRLKVCQYFNAAIWAWQNNTLLYN